MLKKILLIILLIAATLSAQNQDIYFTQTNVIDGLPGDHPFQLIEDRFGYLWMTAETGIFRYDGYEYKYFMFDENDSKSFSGEAGGTICEDASGKIWISHRDGLEYYDYYSKGFIKYKRLPDSLGGYVATMAASNDSSLFLSMGKMGLFRIDKNGEFLKFKILTADDNISFVEGYSELIFFDNAERLWIAQYNYFIIYDLESKSVSKLYLDKSNEIENENSTGNKFFNENSFWIETVYHFKDKELWFGTKDGRIFVINIEGDLYSEEFIISKKLKAFLEGKEITDLFISEENKLWISTDDFQTGLIVVDFKDGSFEHMEANEGVPGYISRNRIHQIYRDQFNTIWMPVGRGGVTRWDPYANKFNKFFDGTKNNLKSRIGRFIELDDGTLLLSDRSANLFKFNPYSNNLEHIVSYADGKSESNRIRSICKWKDDKFIFNTYGDDLYELNLSNNSVKRLQDLDTNLEVYNGIMGKNDVIWYSGKADKKSAIISYEILNGKSTAHLPIENEYPHPFYNYTYSVTVDCFGKIWAGTNGKGFFRFDPIKNDWLKVDHPLTTTVRISYEASDGNIWAGSSKGLFVISTSGEILKKFTTSEGLLHEKVSEITEDNENNIWVQTERGISRISIDDYSIRNFDKNDGYPVTKNNYDLNKLSNGDLVFISDFELMSLDPQNIKDNDVPPKVSLTNLSISGKEIYPYSSYVLDSYIGTTDELDLEYNQNDIEIEYVGIHYSRPERIKYSYFLEGYDSEWSDETNVRTARYTNLPPGDYIFKVKAENADGFWNDEPLELAILINQPFWNTWWAYIIYIMLFVGGLSTLRQVELNRRKKKEEQKLLEAENKRKSQELEEARQLQLSMLPKEIPQLQNLDIAVYTKTATEVGGDYYDFSTKDDGSLNVCLGDATGHGMKAGTLVSIIKSLFISDSVKLGLRHFFVSANETLKKMSLNQMMMAFAMVNIYGQKIKIANAGIPPIYIYRKSKNEVEEVTVNGLPIGAMKNSRYEIYESEIATGDTILMLSDGFPELQNISNEMYGYERLKSIFKQNGNKTSKEIITVLENESKTWAGEREQDDDITFVIIKVK